MVIELVRELQTSDTAATYLERKWLKLLRFEYTKQPLYLISTHSSI